MDDGSIGEQRSGHGFDHHAKYESPLAMLVFDTPLYLCSIWGINMDGGWCPRCSDVNYRLNGKASPNNRKGSGRVDEPTAVRLWWLRRQKTNAPENCVGPETGFTLASLWDQTTDDRPGSNSNFVVGGHLWWPEMREAISKAYPRRVARIETGRYAEHLGGKVGGPMYLWTKEGGINNGMLDDTPRRLGEQRRPRVLTRKDFAVRQETT
jgi:hypothetical protein